MTPLILTLLAFMQAVLFKYMQLSVRKLEEKGVSAISISSLQRWAIIPAAAFFAYAYRPEYLAFIANNTSLLLIIAGIAVSWTIGQYMTYLWLNAASSLSFLYVANAVTYLPVLVGTGIVLNSDLPNGFGLVGLACLAVALAIRPAQHKKNHRALLQYGVWALIAIGVVNVLSHSLSAGLYRTLLHGLSGEVLFGVAVYILLATVMLNIMYLFLRKPSAAEKSIISNHFWVVAAIPACWFIASVPEGFAYSGMPIFTLLALSSVSFLMDTGSDLLNRRIVFNARTALFITLVLVSVVFSVLSLT